jgi:hypothetical protein
LALDAAYMHWGRLIGSQRSLGLPHGASETCSLSARERRIAGRSGEERLERGSALILARKRGRRLQSGCTPVAARADMGKLALDAAYMHWGRLIGSQRRLWLPRGASEPCSLSARERRLAGRSGEGRLERGSALILA